MVIGNANVMDLLSAANYLFVGEVKQCYFAFLASVLNSENCFEILSKAQLIENCYLKSNAVACISHNIANIIEAKTQNNKIKQRHKEHQYLKFLGA